MIPLKLLRGLLQGKKEPEGCEVLESSKNSVTYGVEGFADQVTLENSFIHYLTSWKYNGEIDAFLGELRNVHAIDSITLDILKEKARKQRKELKAITPIIPSIRSRAQTINGGINASIDSAIGPAKLRSSDASKLCRAIDLAGPLSNGKWAMVLGFKTSKPQSAYSWMTRMERDGFLKLHKSKSGVSVEPTASALEALKLLGLK